MYRRTIRQLIDPVAETAPFRTGIVAIDGADADSFTADGTGGEGEATERTGTGEHAYQRATVRSVGDAVSRSTPGIRYSGI